MDATEEHKHAWRSIAHLDFCHWYTTTYLCGGQGPPEKCGATATVSYERDLGANPGARVWMEPVYEEVRRDERGRFVKPHYEERACERCEELKAGAPVRSDVVIVARDGTVIEERHEERPQAPPEEE